MEFSPRFDLANSCAFNIPKHVTPSDGSNIMEDEDLCYRLMDAYDHRATYDFTKLFEGYTSGCDGIVADFTMELAKAYPDAKIVLTYRDPDKWWHSIEYCVNNFVKWPFWIASFWLPIFWLPLKVMYRINRDQIERYGEEVAKSPEFMAARIKEITENIPPKRLLVYQVGKWEPLCKFLNVPVPKEPFPKINDGPTIRKAIMGMIFFVGSSVESRVF